MAVEARRVLYDCTVGREFQRKGWSARKKAMCVTKKYKEAC